MKFFSTSRTSVQRCLYRLFQNQSSHFLLSPLFWKLSQPQDQDRQNGKYTVDCHPNPLQLVSRIYPLEFQWTPKYGLSRIFLEFFSKYVYSTMAVEKFQIYSVKITDKYISETKNWIYLFLLMPTSKNLPQVFIITPQAEGNCPFLQRFLKIYFFSAENRGGVGGVYGVEKITKLNLRGYWS